MPSPKYLESEIKLDNLSVGLRLRVKARKDLSITTLSSTDNTLKRSTIIINPTYFGEGDSFCHPFDTGCSVSAQILHLCKKQYFVDNVNRMLLGTAIKSYLSDVQETTRSNTSALAVEAALDELFGRLAARR